MNPDGSHLDTWLSEASRAAKRRRHRLTLIIRGESDWCRAQAVQLWRQWAPSAGLWLGETVPGGPGANHGIRSLAPAAFRQALGGEHDLLLVDALDSFSANAFAALSGSLIGGGLLVVLWPDHAPDAEHAHDAERGAFRRRCERLWATGADTWIYTPDSPALSPPGAEPAAPAIQVLTGDQREAMSAVLSAAQGHRNRPVALVADRGRGKSAVLGMAAAHLQQLRPRRILVTAPRVDAVASVFRHAALGWPDARHSRLRLHHGAGEIAFIAVDALLREQPAADLLLIDEAAAMGMPNLHGLLRRYPRIVFATTVHGYEGSGRGFDVRFTPVLDQQTPGWRRVVMREPVRWADRDPLEAMLGALLVLDAEPPLLDVGAGAATPRIERVDAAALADNEPLLRQVFALLAEAHYQTTPDDLRLVLDDPAARLWVSVVGEQPVAVCLTLDEGGFDAATAAAIWQAERRPRGHLLAQSLAVHGGLRGSLQLKGRRVLRIAVHRDLRRHRIGKALLAAVVEASREAGIDYLGSSFAGAEDVLAFWAQSALLPARLGVHRDGSSGQYSVQVLRGLSTAGERLVAEALAAFAESLPLLLADAARDLEPALALRLLTGTAIAAPLAARSREILALYANGQRQFEACLAPLHQLVRRLPGAALTVPDAPLLSARLVQRWSWAQCAQYFDGRGRRDIEQRIRAVVQSLLQQSA